MTDLERRKTDRDADASWETIALQRVARRVEDLAETPPEADDFGWEETVLEKLRRRLATPEGP